jgi:hypothetical protein
MAMGDAKMGLCYLERWMSLFDFCTVELSHSLVEVGAIACDVIRGELHAGRRLRDMLQLLGW